MDIALVNKALATLRVIQGIGLKIIMENSVFYNTGSREAVERFQNQIHTEYLTRSVVQHDRVLTGRK